MKPILRIRQEKTPPDNFPNSPRKDCSISLIKTVAVLVIFTTGVFIGFSATSHFSHNKSREFFTPALYTKITENDPESFENFLKPKSLKHNMSDEELFWRASLLSNKRNYPYKRVPKVAFLFLTRRDLPLAPLWERFLHGYEEQYSVYVHSLPNYKLKVSISSPFHGREIPSQVQDNILTSMIHEYFIYEWYHNSRLCHGDPYHC